MKMKATVLATLALSAFAPLVCADASKTMLFVSTDADVTAVGSDPGDIKDKFMVKVSENVKGVQRYKLKVAFRHDLNLPDCATATKTYGDYMWKRQLSAAVTGFTGLTYASINYNPCASPEPTYTVSVYGTSSDPWTTVTCASGTECAISGAGAAQADIDNFTGALARDEPFMRDYTLGDKAYNGVGALWDAPVVAVDDTDGDEDDTCSATFGTYNGETVSMSYTVGIDVSDEKDEFGELECVTKTRWAKRQHDDNWPVRATALSGEDRRRVRISFIGREKPIKPVVTP